MKEEMGLYMSSVQEKSGGMICKRKRERERDIVYGWNDRKREMDRSMDMAI